MRSLIWLALAAITLGEETCGDEFTKVEWGGGSMCVALMGSGSFNECEKDVCQAAGGHLACFSSDDAYRAVYEALLHDLKGGWPHGCAFFRFGAPGNAVRAQSVHCVSGNMSHPFSAYSPDVLQIAW